MKLSEIKALCHDSKIEVTMHFLQKMTTRGITYSEVKEAIMNGEILEKYPDDYPYPSCLIFGYTLQNRVLHVVVGIEETKLWLITVYEPDPELWDIDFKHRRDT